MAGLGKFQKAILDAVTAHILPLLESERAEFAEATKNHLFGLGGPTVIKSSPSERKTHLYRVFYGFAEIAKSLERLEDIEFLIGRFPYRNTRITKEGYLQFTVECHLQEIYLLQQRLERYMTMLERQYKGNTTIASLRGINKTLRGTIKRAMEGPVQARGEHMHASRFEDNDIKRLGGIGLLARNGDDATFAGAMGNFYRSEYSKIRKSWKGKIAANNDAIRKLLDVFFEALYSVVFDQNNALRYPNRLKS